MPTEPEAIRLDKWLWTARFFKTRKLAAIAVSGGKVHINNQRTKPGKEIKPGTLLSISKDGLRRDITIIALSSQRRSAKEAILLYEESAESLAKRQQQIIEQREQRELYDFSGQDHKPNKKERRLIHRFKQV
ncbi:MAG: S4 domain-containing protein [Methylococcales bacterium]|nr:S4 domain-containing protein [Methylococcales bacterium]